MNGRELLELDRADGRNDVVFNDSLIALGGVVADVGLAVGFKPVSYTHLSWILSTPLLSAN